MEPPMEPPRTPSSGARPDLMPGVRPPTLAGRGYLAARRVVRRLGSVGVAPGDSDEVRAQKGALVIAVAMVAVLATVWVAVYLALGLPVAAAIPFGYQLASIAGIVLFARTRDYRRFRFATILLMLVLPFVLQWSLGGYVTSSAVSLWGLVAAIGALFFYSSRDAIPWFAGFVALTVVSGLADPFVSQDAPDIRAPVVEAFFVLNVLGVALTAYVLLQYSVRERDSALAVSNALLGNVLPQPIADRLKRTRTVIADRHDDVTVMFADIANFTEFAERTSAERLVGVLDDIFTLFDDLTAARRLEKIKTIGDAYMAVGGLPEPRADHVEAVVELALTMQAELGRMCEASDLDLALRIGIASGPVVAGVIGRNRFLYDLWGDTVNTASRMESHGVVGRIQVTADVAERLGNRYRFEARGPIDVKGKGLLETYLLDGRRAV